MESLQQTDETQTEKRPRLYAKVKPPSAKQIEKAKKAKELLRIELLKLPYTFRLWYRLCATRTQKEINEKLLKEGANKFIKSLNNNRAYQTYLNHLSTQKRDIVIF